jgi:hypothetical protein
MPLKIAYLFTDSAHNAARSAGESGIRVSARSRAGRCALKKRGIPILRLKGRLTSMQTCGPFRNGGEL